MDIHAQDIGSVSVITIDNERKRNAISVAMEEKLRSAFERAERSPNVRAVVVTGSGDIAFSSGHDLNEVGSSVVYDESHPDPVIIPLSMRKPVLAAVNGHCYAAGLVLALCCDIRIASENATFGSPGAKLGMLPVGRQISRLSRIMGASRAAEFMMTAEPMKADTALRLGFVNSVVAKGEAKAEAIKLAERIAANSPSTVQAIKEGIWLSERAGEASFEIFEREAAARLKKGSDAEEGKRAFLEKRKPAFGDI